MSVIQLFDDTFNIANARQYRLTLMHLSKKNNISAYNIL